MLRQNKSAQFLAGLFTIYCCFLLFRNGFFDAWLYPAEEGQSESVELLPMFIGAVVSAVNLVGLVSLSIVAGLGPVVEGLMGKAQSLFQKSTKPTDVDTDELNKVLTKISDRLDSLEARVP